MIRSPAPFLAIVLVAAAAVAVPPTAAPPASAVKPSISPDLLGAVQPLAAGLRVTIVWPPAVCGQPAEASPCSSVLVCVQKPPHGPCVQGTDTHASAKPGSATGECEARFTGLEKGVQYGLYSRYTGAWNWKEADKHPPVSNVRDFTIPSFPYELENRLRVLQANGERCPQRALP